MALSDAEVEKQVSRRTARALCVCVRGRVRIGRASRDHSDVAP